MTESFRRRELLELSSAACDGRLDDDSFARLEAILSESDEACALWLAHMKLDADLRVLVATSSAERHTLARLSASGALTEGNAEQAGLYGTTSPSQYTGQAPRSPVLGFLGSAFEACGHFLSRSFVLTLLLAIGLPGLILLMLVIDISRQPVAPVPVAHMPATVAEVTRQSECVWEQSTPALPVGTHLCSGQKLLLRKGLVELTFSDGATVLLEGPATFDINTGARGFLRAGKLVAKVPKGAEGFVIATPSATIIDLGTEFALAVAPTGATEAFVFQGKVNVSVESAIEDRKKIHQGLTAGQAVRIAAAKNNATAPRIEPIAMTSTQFMRHVPGTLPEPTIIFAHRGANDPVSEGWKSFGGYPGKGGKPTVEAGPIEDNGTAAWSLRTVADNKTKYYAVGLRNKLAPELMDEAKKKGWMYRGRIWVNPQLPPTEDPKQCLCLFTYHRDDNLTWGIHVLLDKEGNQLLKLFGDSSLGTDVVIPVPNSRGRYVDYEVRKVPERKGADVFIDSRLVATDFSKKLPESTPTIRFGMRYEPSDIRCAQFEWGIFRETPEPNNPTQPTSHTEPRP